MKMGETDTNGTLAFDSPSGSHGQYWIVLQDVGAGGLHYFLAKNLFIEYDTLASFLPDLNNTATLDVQMEEVASGQTGVVYLRRTDMPVEFSNAYAYPPGSVRVDPTEYSAWTLTTVETLQSTWTYQTAPVTIDLGSAPSASIQFAGHLKPKAQWTQVQDSVTVDWNVTDAYGNQIVDVIQENIGILSAGETISHQPFLSLWNPQGILLAAGYVEWSQTLANVTVPQNESLAFVQIDLETGAYPFDNIFELVAEVLDSKGVPLPEVAATADVSVDVQGTVLLSGEPIAINLTINSVPVQTDANGTFLKTVNLTKGLNTVTIAAKDLAGNERSLVYVIHSKPDILLRVDPLPEFVNVSQVEVQGRVEQDALLTVNDEEVQPDEEGLFQVTLSLSEGPNTIIVTAEDYLGSTKEVVQEVVMDTIPPEISIITPASGHRTLDENITIVGRTEATATLIINGKNVAHDEGDFVHVTDLNEGDNAFLMEATDLAGNVQRMTLTVYREPLILGAPVSYMVYIIPAIAAAAVPAVYLLGRRTQKAQDLREGAQEAAKEEA